jgi:hypothetical protein
VLEWVLQLPNGIGVVFGVAQLLLYLMYRKAKPLNVYPENGKVVGVESGKAKPLNGYPEKGKVGDDSVKAKPPNVYPEKGKVGDESVLEKRIDINPADKPDANSVKCIENAALSLQVRQLLLKMTAPFPEKGKVGDESVPAMARIDIEPADKPDAKKCIENAALPLQLRQLY